MSVSLVRDNLRGLRENLKHTIRSLATHLNAPMPHQGQPQQDQPQQQQPQQPHPVQVPTPGLEEPKFHLTLPTSLPPVSLALPQVKNRPCQWNLKKTTFQKEANNVCPKKKNTKRSCVLLLRLVFFFLEQTLLASF